MRQLELAYELQQEIKRLEADLEKVRASITAYMEDTGKTRLVDELNGIEARLSHQNRRSIDASMLDDATLRLLADSDLITVKTAAVAHVPPAAVSSHEVTILKIYKR